MNAAQANKDAAMAMLATLPEELAPRAAARQVAQQVATQAEQAFITAARP
ncbi:MAG: hypothetical protein R3B96_14140 [Pirellulaceae bacterium]